MADNDAPTMGQKRVIPFWVKVLIGIPVGLLVLWGSVRIYGRLKLSAAISAIRAQGLATSIAELAVDYPEVDPEENGAPEARAIPKQSGRATRKTTKPAGRSYFMFAIKFV